MAYAPPQPQDLFDGPDAAARYQEVINRIKDAGNAGLAGKSAGDFFSPGVGIVKSANSQALDVLNKAGVSPDLVKEWELGTPIAQTAVQYTGITAYNVESALLMIVPKELKLRNRTPRQKGVGQGIEYRRITSVSNSGGSSANLSPFFSSVSNTASINGVTWNLPPLISYTGDTTFKAFVEMGFTDTVSVQQQFAAQGFTDAKAVSALALIWADMLGEERQLLNAVSTVLSVSGVSATAAQSTHTTSGSGLPAITTGAVLFSFQSATGESKAVSASTVTVAAGYGIDLTFTGTIPANVVAVNTYVTATGPVYYKGTTVLQNGFSPTTFATVAALPSTSADNGSFYSNGYDGMIQEFSNTSLGGYQKVLNGTLSSSTPGTEFTTALQSLYVTQGADPDAIYTTGSIAKVLFDNLATQGSANSYRLNLTSGDNGTIMGGAVTGIVNPATGKVVDIGVHRYMPAGTAVIHSWQVPWPDSGVTSTMKVVNTVDTMVIDWPWVDMAYKTSTYRYGTLIFEAPILSGIITAIND